MWHLSTPFLGFLGMQSKQLPRHAKDCTYSSLNSLFGISVNATYESGMGLEEYAYFPLNSLSGISVNATDTHKHMTLHDKIVYSQFPFWDFFECNNATPILDVCMVPTTWYLLSIPFLGFL
jgi:hypothetical protein